jgi:large subunit ribosomal protein L24
MNKIKRDDEVIIISGKCKGKRGNVLRILDKKRIIVSGVNIIKKHQKPNPSKKQAGDIIEKEAPIDVSNAAIYNAARKKNDRVGFKITGNGLKVRIFKSDGTIIGA